MDHLDSFLESAPKDNIDDFLDGGDFNVKESGPKPSQNYGVGNRSAAYTAAGLNADVPVWESDPLIHPTKALLTNEPVGFLDSTIRSIPATLGGVAGGAIGLGGGPPGVAAGSFAGGTIGEGARQGLVGLYAKAGHTQMPTFGGASVDALKSGAVQGITAGAGELGSAAWQAVKPSALRAGSQILRNATGIAEKYGAAALENPVLTSAFNPAAVNAEYRAFEEGAKLTSPRLARALSGDLVETSGGAMGTIKQAGERLAPFIDKEASLSSGNVIYDKDAILNALKSGQLPPDTTQLLYDGSQAGAHLQRLAKSGSPAESANYANIGTAKENFDSILEAIQPGYAKARQTAFNSAVGEQFSSPFPLNQNQSANALRGVQSMGIAGAAIPTAMATGSPIPLLALAAPVVTSPLAVGAMLRGAARVLPAAAAGARWAPSALEQYYRAQSWNKK